MELFINQRVFHLSKDATLLEALAAFGAEPPFAVALNGVFVHRSDYASKALSPLDRIEVVQPVAGG